MPARALVSASSTSSSQVRKVVDACDALRLDETLCQPRSSPPPPPPPPDPSRRLLPRLHHGRLHCGQDVGPHQRRVHLPWWVGGGGVGGGGAGRSVCFVTPESHLRNVVACD